MPTITDATVVSGSIYSTEGNGGRKLVRLDNKWLVAVVKTNNYFYFYKTEKGDWSDKVQLCYINSSTITMANDISISSKGNYIYAIHSGGTNTIASHVIDAETITNVNLYSTRTSIDIGQTALGKVTLAINEAKTELHAAWVSKNSAYPNSFNTRYAKGTINADGTVTWGAVEQLTHVNVSSTKGDANPSIIVNKDGYPMIFHDYNNNTPTNLIECHMFNGTSWEISKTIYRDDGYTQSSPSAIYVPQSINGLANGRIWVTWSGTDNTDPNNYQIRVAYSDDSGLTWSSMNKLTSESESQTNPSITFNNNNEGFIVFDGWDTKGTANDIKMVRYSNNSWSAVEMISEGTTGTKAYPSTLLDLTLDFSFPLFTYTDLQNSKIGFYGSWSVETISPTVGERGQILNRQNILTYNITSDSTIGTVTEKINGVVVGTKTLTSGQNTTVNITQAQWDSIPYGKYRNNSAGRNTIEIVTSNNTFTYTFVKWLDNTVDILSSTKAVKDSKDYYLPSAKKILSDAINSKGGSTTPTDSIENMAVQITLSSDKKYKEGTATSLNSTKAFVNGQGSSTSNYYISIDTDLLGFEPQLINIIKTDKSYGAAIVWMKEYFVDNSTYKANHTMGTLFRVPFVSGILDLPVNASNAQYKWYAYE